MRRRAPFIGWSSSGTGERKESPDRNETDAHAIRLNVSSAARSLTRDAGAAIPDSHGRAHT